MKSETGSTTIWTLLRVFGALVVVASLLPPFAEEAVTKLSWIRAPAKESGDRVRPKHGK